MSLSFKHVNFFLGLQIGSSEADLRLPGGRDPSVESMNSLMSHGAGSSNASASPTTTPRRHSVTSKYHALLCVCVCVCVLGVSVCFDFPLYAFFMYLFVCVAYS